MKHRIHLIVSGWLPVAEHYQSCAFTQKAIKFAKMMQTLGDEVYIYGVKSEIYPVPACTEFIETHTVADIREAYGEGDNRFEIGYDWPHALTFKYDENGFISKCSEKFFASLVREIGARYKDGDIVCLTFGQYYKEITDALSKKFPHLIYAEYGIGYPHAFAPYRAHESAHIQNWIYGAQANKNLRAYDRVIPNFFDPAQFPFVDRDKKRDYLLYIGRLIPRKGIYIAVRIAEKLKIPLLMAGQGELVGKSDYVTYVGFADREKRAALMAYAKAVIVPTVYLEPFGGVAVEAQLCGTPVITANTGAFPETVVQGVTGYRCDTFQQYIDAVGKVDSLDPKVIRKHAERYSMDVVKYEYQEWFDEIVSSAERFRAGNLDPFFTVDKKGV